MKKKRKRKLSPQSVLCDYLVEVYNARRQPICLVLTLLIASRVDNDLIEIAPELNHSCCFNSSAPWMPVCKRIPAWSSVSDSQLDWGLAVRRPKKSNEKTLSFLYPAVRQFHERDVQVHCPAVF